MFDSPKDLWLRLFCQQVFFLMRNCLLSFFIKEILLTFFVKELLLAFSGTKFSLIYEKNMFQETCFNILKIMKVVYNAVTLACLVLQNEDWRYKYKQIKIDRTIIDCNFKMTIFCSFLVLFLRFFWKFILV